MERFRNIVSKPLVLLAIILVAIGSLVTTIVVNNICASKIEEVSKYPIEKIEEDENGKLIAITKNSSALTEENYYTVKQKYDSVVYPEKAATDVIEQHIKYRYNSPSLSLEERKEKALAYVSAEYYDTVRQEMEKESYDSFKLLKVFHNGRSLNTLDDSMNVLSYVCLFEINGKQKYYTVFCERGARDSQEWKIKSMTKICDA